DVELESLRVVLRQERIEIAKPLDETPVPRIAAVSHHDVIDGPLLGAGAGHPDFQRHSIVLSSIDRLPPVPSLPQAGRQGRGSAISSCRSPEGRRGPAIRVPWGRQDPADCFPAGQLGRLETAPARPAYRAEASAYLGVPPAGHPASSLRV